MKFKFLTLLTWAALLIAIWVIGAQTWYQVTTESGKFAMSGSTSWPALSTFFWFSSVSIIAMLVFQRVVALIIAVLNALVFSYSNWVLFAAVRSGQPMLDQADIAKIVGANTDYQIAANSYGSFELIVLVCLVLVQLTAAVAAFRAPLRVRNYDADANRAENDPISLWDSQREDR